MADNPPARRRGPVYGQRRRHINITLSVDEHATISAAAAAAGMAEAAWCAEVVLAAATATGAPDTVPPERLSELAATLLPALVAAHRLRDALDGAEPTALAAIEARAAAAEAALTALLRGGEQP